MPTSPFLPIVRLLVALLGLVLGASGCKMSHAPSEQDSLEQARSFMVQHDYRSAIVDLKSAIQAKPDNPESRFLLGQAYVAVLLGSEAEAEYRRAMALGMTSAPVVEGLAKALLLQKKAAEALQVLDAGGGFSQDEAADISALRGQALLAQGDMEGAQAAIADAVRLRPGSVSVLLAKADLDLIAGRQDDARAAVERVLKIEPSSVLGWTLLGNLERAQGHLRAAEQAYTKAAEHGPVYGTYMIQRAQVRTELGDFKGARADIQQLKRHMKLQPELALTEGMLDVQEGKISDAQTQFETVLARDPKNVKAALALGSIHFSRGEWEQANAYLSQVSGAFPKGEGLARMLATVRLRLGDAASAEEALRPFVVGGSGTQETRELMGKIRAAEGKVDEPEPAPPGAEGPEASSPEHQIALGERLLQSTKTTQAIDTLEAAVAQRPESFPGRVLLFAAYYKQGMIDKAQAAAREMTKRWPDKADTWKLMGLVLTRTGDLSGAKQAFERALAAAPGDPSAAGNLAALAARAGDRATARKYYGQILEHKPGDLQTQVNLAILDLQDGRDAAFRERLEALIKENPKALSPRVILATYYIKNDVPLRALTLLREVEKDHRDDPRLLGPLFRGQMAAQDYTNAARTGERLVALAPGDASARYLLARAYAENRNRQGLREQLYAALKLDPAAPDADTLITRLVGMSADVEQARQVYADLRKTFPDLPRFVDEAAKAALDKGDRAGALAIYRRAAEASPQNTRSVLRLAAVEEQMGDSAKAQARLRAWLSQRPQDTAAELALASILMRQGSAKEAISSFERVLTLSPDNVEALNNLAWLLRSEDPKRALGYAEQAADRAGKSANVLDTLGLALLANGQAARAGEVLAKASALKPESAEIKLHLARAREALGQRDQAIAILESLAAGDDASVKAETQALLARLKHAGP